MATLMIGGVLMDLPFVTSAACKRLVDNDNSFIRSMARIATPSNASTPQTMRSDVEVAQMFAPFDTAFPWISQCVASIKYWDLLVSLAKSDKAMQCWTKWTSSVPPQELNDDYFRDFYCPQFLETTAPCIVDVLVPAIRDAMDSAQQQCCEPMKQRVPALFGLDLASFAEVTMQHLGNVLCSEKTFRDRMGNQMTQTCGYSLMTSFISESVFDTVLLALQISNTQGCRAMSGLKFFSTQGMAAQLFGDEPLGVCYAPIDALLQQLSRLPVVKSLILRKDGGKLVMYFASLFGAGRCLRGELLGDWVTSESNPVLLSAGFIDAVAGLFNSVGVTTQAWNDALTSLNVSYATSETSKDVHYHHLNITNAIRRALSSLTKTIKPLCLHLPNSFQCGYNGGILALPIAGASTSISQSLLTNSMQNASGTTRRSPMHRALVVLSAMLCCWAFWSIS